MSMNNPWRAFELAYVTIELESAFIVGAADGDNLFDAVFVTDANGLPCIPGESLAGILRHALAGENDPADDEVCCKLFGYQKRGDGSASRIRISFGQVHDQFDNPVAFRSINPKKDEVLAALSAGVGRDHVRIGGHGAVDQRGKFDQLLVPAGARFTFEVSVSSEAGTGLNELLAILARADVRVGGKTRGGLGKFKVVRVKTASFDLAKKADLRRLSELPVAMEKAVHSKVLSPAPTPEAPKSKSGYHALVKLRPIGTWMIGGGMPSGNEPERSKDEPWDRLPLRERRIEWGGKGGKVVDDAKAPFLLPATSVKGALRHRTTFHAHRLNQRWLNGQAQSECPEADLLFGQVRDGDQGEPGRVFLSDVYLSPLIDFEALQHVSLDRFTQGPMDHLLYDELVLGQCEVNLDLSIDASCAKNEFARRALQAALDDLCQGRLALGAGRGHGRFVGEIHWLGDRKLLEEEAVTC